MVKKSFKSNKNNNFIDGYYMSDLSICDDLINYFEDSNNKVLGETSDGVDKNIKDSLDLQLSINDITNSPALDSYFKELIKAVNLYKEKYKFYDEKVNKWGLQHDFNIQKYKPSQA